MGWNQKTGRLARGRAEDLGIADLLEEVLDS
jgi:hypothetical protein